MISLLLACVALTPKFVSEPPDNDTLIPVYDVLVTGVNKVGADWWIDGRFKVSAPFASGGWPANAKKPQIYVSNSSEFDPNATWRLLGETTNWSDEPGKQALVTFHLKLPSIAYRAGVIVVTLDGKSNHNDSEVSFASIPYPSTIQGTSGALINAIVPITVTPPAEHTGNSGTRRRHSIYLNQPWSTWEPNGVNGRPHLFRLVSGQPTLDPGGFWIEDHLTDTDAGTCFDDGNKEVALHVTRSGHTHIMVYCYDLSEIDGFKYDQISGVIRKI